MLLRPNVLDKKELDENELDKSELRRKCTRRNITEPYFLSYVTLAEFPKKCQSILSSRLTSYN